MKANLKYIGIVIALFVTLGMVQNASARDLIVVADKAVQNDSKDWLGFLESKEIPVKLVTPESFSEYQEELYIFVLGSLDQSDEIKKIAQDALTDDEYKEISKSSEGKMYYKPQAWNIGQKVILILGQNKNSLKEARIDTQSEWYDMLKEWFDIEDTEGFHVY